MSERIKCTTGMMIPAGTVSEGTLRVEDLLAAALHTYEACNPAGFVVLSLEHSRILRPFASSRSDQLLVGAPFDWDEAQMGRLIDLCGAVVDGINEALPDGWEYGSHPDDSACIGIWHQEANS